MPRAERARRALELARLSIQVLLVERPREDRWLVQWAASVALLRAVGHALEKVDRETDADLGRAIDEAWDRWKRHPDQHRIFWEFIDDTRNSILKELDPKAAVAGVGIKMTGTNTGQLWKVYEVQVPGFEGWKHDRLLREAARWWEAELGKIEMRASTGSQPPSARRSLDAGPALPSLRSMSGTSDFETALNMFGESFAAGDAEALGDLFGEDARALQHHEPALIGRTAIADMLRQVFASFDTSQFEIDYDIVDVHQDRAYVLAAFQETLRSKHGATKVEVDGRLVAFWRRDDDGWRIIRLLTSRASPDRAD